MSGRQAQRIGAWAGMAVPVTFVGVILVEGLLRPGYDSASMFASALSLGPRGWVQQVNFIVTGVLFLVFARGVAAEFGAKGRVGASLLVIMGLCLFPAGIFAMDPISGSPANASWSRMTPHSQLHYAFSAVFFSLAPASCFVFFGRFRREPHWRPLARWTLATGILLVLEIGVLKIGMTTATGGFSRWVGLVQRSILIPYFAWIFAFGLRLPDNSDRG
jgi:Protein of unknown function (DUF998)